MHLGYLHQFIVFYHLPKSMSLNSLNFDTSHGVRFVTNVTLDVQPYRPYFSQYASASWIYFWNHQPKSQHSDVTVIIFCLKTVCLIPVVHKITSFKGLWCPLCVRNKCLKVVISQISLIFEQLLHVPLETFQCHALDAACCTVHSSMKTLC